MLMILLYHNVRLLQASKFHFCEKVAKTPVRHLLKFSHFQLAIAQKRLTDVGVAQILGNTGFLQFKNLIFAVCPYYYVGAVRLPLKNGIQKRRKCFDMSAPSLVNRLTPKL